MSNKSGSGSLYMLSDAVVDQIDDLLKSSSKNDGPVVYDDSGSDDEMSIPCNENKNKRTEIQNISRLRQFDLGCVFIFAMDNLIVLVECDKFGRCSRVTDANNEKMMR